MHKKQVRNTVDEPWAHEMCAVISLGSKIYNRCYFHNMSNRILPADRWGRLHICVNAWCKNTPGPLSNFFFSIWYRFHHLVFCACPSLLSLYLSYFFSLKLVSRPYPLRCIELLYSILKNSAEIFNGRLIHAQQHVPSVIQ